MSKEVRKVSSWINTYSGQTFDFQNIEIDSIYLVDIATALSNICRFGGHLPGHYSVAHHSLLAASLAKKDGHNYDVLKAILFHDATEAYTGDMVLPLKNIMPEFKDLEGRVRQAISVRFEIDFDSHEEIIKNYDLMMLKVEKNTFFSNEPEWDILLEIPLREIKIHEISIPLIRKLFLSEARMYES